MYKVLFAEDEMLVRIGLKNSVAWSDYHMEIVADEENGIAAFEKFCEWKPDLVITDIKMSGMDGCELIRKIRSQDTKCGIIIISCLDDFKTLHDMVKYNILDYILKASMTMDEINGVLEKALAYLDHNIGRKEDQKESVTFDELLTMYTVKQQITYETFKSEMEQLNDPINQTVNTFVLFKVPPCDSAKINSLGIAFVRNLVKENIKNSHLFLCEEYGFCLISDDVIKAMDNRLLRITQLTRSFLGIDMKIVTIPVQDNYRSLPNDYKEAAFCYERMMEQIEKEGSTVLEPAIVKAIGYIHAHYKSSLH